MPVDKKKASESFTIMTELVLPNDTNMLGNLMGGKLMQWMDIASAIAAQRHSNCLVVTASVDNVSFAKPIQLGNAVTLKAQVSRSFHSSMEVHIEVTAENIPGGDIIESNLAFFTMVALDKNGSKMEVPEVIPENGKEQRLYDDALRRRQLRLVLANRMRPEEADELKSIFKL